MGRMSDLYFEIETLLSAGVSPEHIAKQLNVSVQMVLDVQRSMEFNN